MFAKCFKAETKLAWIQPLPCKIHIAVLSDGYSGRLLVWHRRSRLVPVMGDYEAKVADCETGAQAYAGSDNCRKMFFHFWFFV